MDNLSDQVSTADASLLYELHRIWADRYVIAIRDGGTWAARRKMEGAREFTADSGETLRGMIESDDQARVAPQDLWKLRAEWGKHYRISHHDGQWRARRNMLDPRTLTAGTPDDLAELMAIDRLAWTDESASQARKSQ